MVYTKKAEKETTDEKKDVEKVRIDDEDGFWLNRTKSGKGVIIVLADEAYISSLTNVQEFANGKRKGVKFSHLLPAEEK